MIGTPTCPDCNGNRRTLAHVHRGDRPHTWEMLDCATCGGEGLVSREHLERIREGESRREGRKSRGLSLREEAARLGITPVALAAIENGRIPEPSR